MKATMCKGLAKRALCWRMPATQLKPPAAPQGILVVDDEPAVRRLLQVLLASRGFPSVWLAADGPEAIEIYRRQQHRIGLVLLDVRMHGLDGPQTLAALRKINPSVRCCFMSGETGAYTVAGLYRRGAAGFLGKPFSLVDVVRTIARLARPEPAVAV